MARQSASARNEIYPISKPMSKQPMTVAQAGRKGGHARAAKLTKERRSEIARLGYLASPLSAKHESRQLPPNGEKKK